MTKRKLARLFHAAAVALCVAGILPTLAGCAQNMAFGNNGVTAPGLDLVSVDPQDPITPTGAVLEAMGAWVDAINAKQPLEPSPTHTTRAGVNVRLLQGTNGNACLVVSAIHGGSPAQSPTIDQIERHIRGLGVRPNGLTSVVAAVTVIPIIDGKITPRPSLEELSALRETADKEKANKQKAGTQRVDAEDTNTQKYSGYADTALSGTCPANLTHVIHVLTRSDQTGSHPHKEAFFPGQRDEAIIKTYAEIQGPLQAILEVLPRQQKPQPRGGRAMASKAELRL